MEPIPCTISPPPPPKHGQKWTPDDDRQITDAPGLGDEHLAATLGRSTHAVQSRRAVLAARLHAVSGRPIAECAREYGASAERTATAAAVGEEKRKARGPSNAAAHEKTKETRVATGEHADGGRRRQLIDFITTTTKPARHKVDDQRTATREPVVSILRRSAPPQPTAASAIGIICSYIKRNAGGGGGGGGRVVTMNELWAQEALVPTLVQYHAGFQAYATYVSGRKGVGRDESARTKKVTLDGIQ